MTLSAEDWEALKSNHGYIIWLDGEQVPVGAGFDYEHLYEVFNDLVKHRGVEGAAKELGYKSDKEMVLDLAEWFDHSDYTMDDWIFDTCGGQEAEDIDYSGDAADHKADELAGR